MCSVFALILCLAGRPLFTSSSTYVYFPMKKTFSSSVMIIVINIIPLIIVGFQNRVSGIF
jgi:hypothetical protein